MINCKSKSNASIPVVLIAIGSMFATFLPAQDSLGTPTGKLCWRGKPKPSCDAFVITEFGLYGGLVRPTTTVTAAVYENGPLLTETMHEEPVNVFWEVGRMNNVSRQSAFGATALIGYDGHSLVLGVKSRHRRWLTAGGTALDIGLGLRTWQTAHGGPRSRAPKRDVVIGHAPALTADIAINSRDNIALVARADVGKYGLRMQPNIALGIRAGSKPATFTTAGLLAGCSLAMVLFMIGYSEST